jgi:hypothetical protein
MAGVRLATGYIEISAETSKVPQQIQDALNKAGTAAAKPAGTQMGKDISAGIQDGLKAGASSSSTGSVISDVIAGKTIGGAVRTQGQKVGKELGTGINQGINDAVRSGTGPKIDEAISKATKPKETGEKIGKEINEGVGGALKDLGKESFDELKKGAKEWGTGVANELKKGDIKGAFGDVGDVVENTTSMLNTLSKVVGVNLDSVENFGRDTAKTLDQVGGGVQVWVDRVKGGVGDAKTFADTVKGIGSGDASTRIKATSDALGLLADNTKKLTGADISGVTKPLQDIAGTAGGIAEVAASIKEIGSAAGIGGLSGTLGAISTALGPLAVAFAATFGPFFAFLNSDAGRRLKELPAGPEYPGAGLFPGFKGAPTEGSVAELLGAPPPPAAPPPSGDQDKLDAVNRERAAKGLPPVRLPGAPPPAVEAPGVSGYFNLVAPPAPAAGRPSVPDIAPIDVGGGPLPTLTRPGFKSDPFYAGATVSAPQANITSSTANVTAGSVNVSGGASSAALAASPTYAGKKTWYDTGGSIGGSGAVPIIGHGGEHVLTTGDVDAMGGQDAVYAWRNALHYDDGGEVKNQQWLKDAATKAGMTPDQYVAAMAHTPPAQSGMAGPGNMPLDQQQSDMHQNLLGQGTDQAGQNIAALSGSDRTGGFVPVGAGSKAVAGTSFVSGLLNLGNEAVGGLIDTGAEAAQAAAAVGGFGAGGAAAGPAIQLGASEAKRAVSYGFQMAGILADAGIEQLFGVFGGAPRWLGYDYTQFIPNINTGDIGTTTLEKAMGASKDGKQAPGQQPGGPVTPEHLPGEQPVGPPVPKFGDPSAQQPALGGLAQTGQGAQAGDIKAGLAAGLAAGGVGAPPPAPGSASPAPAPPPQGGGGMNLLQGLIPGFGMDEGGMLPHNSMAINTSGRPELVLSPQQLDAMGTSGNKNPYSRGGDTINITAVDAQDVAAQIDKRKRLAAMQYNSRP